MLREVGLLVRSHTTPRHGNAIQVRAPGLWTVQPHFIPRKSLPTAKALLVHLSLTLVTPPDLRHHRRTVIMNPRMQEETEAKKWAGPRPPDL